MVEQPMNPLIAIAGPPGSGKSELAASLARRLEQQLSHPVINLDMDDFQAFTLNSPEALKAWHQRGGDYNEFDLNPLPELLQRLKRGEAISLPDRTLPAGHTCTILLQTHFGREHAACREPIDRLIWLDLPLDLALARKLSSLTQHFQQIGMPSDQQREWLEHYLAHYQTIVRDTLIQQAERVRPQADWVLDANQAVATLTEQAIQLIEPSRSVRL